MHVVYLINQYPKVSHSFIRRELVAVERLGVKVSRVASRGWQEAALDPEDRAEQGKTFYLLQEGLARLLVDLFWAAATRPGALAQAVACALGLSRRSERPVHVHLAYVLQACKLARFVRTRSVDHVHAHFGTNPAEVALLCSVLSGVPYSFTVHGPEEFDKPVSLHVGDKAAKAKFVAAVSSFGRSQLFRWVAHAHWNKIHQVHCGLDDLYLHSPSGPATAPRRLVFIGRLCEQKGPLLLIEAARLVAARGIDFELMFGGDGELRDQVQDLARKYGLSSRVRVTGWLTSEQVLAHLRAARALILPSFAEGLPVVLMEAMAVARPVITTWVAGIPELVENGTTGWLVPPGDASALAEAMVQCLQAEPEALIRMGNASQARVRQRHAASSEAAKLVALFGMS